MFEIKWANKKLNEAEKEIIAQPSKLFKKEISLVLELIWEEHCVECAIPECYTMCSLFEERGDKTCARFVYGIFPNKNFKGHYNFGADVRFRKWGKIEANLNKFLPSPIMGHCFLNLFMSLPNKIRYLIKAMLVKKYFNEEKQFDAFVVECYSPQEFSFRLILEHFIEKDRFRTTKFRHAFVINKGHNFFSVPFEDFNISNLDGYVCLYPESSKPEKRVVFTWLDFIKYKQNVNIPSKSEKKIKCVAWDLDQTVWHGTLSEEKNVSPNLQALKLIRLLDERGIIQTVISKNDFRPAWQKLVDLKLDQYFLFPAINWGQKSENLKKISKKLNIDLDVFAVIDDSIFEREEIKKALPETRVYNEMQIPKILEYSEFDVPITDISKERRLAYLTESKREKIKSSFSGSYESFLRSCKMRLEAFVPQAESDVLRCWELIQRSNQLNLSSKRYLINEFNSLLLTKTVLPIALRCQDKFGKYGIIGFLSIKFSNNCPVLEDFVLSCRVAQKKIEHTFLQEFSKFLLKKDFDEFLVRLIKTSKNLPLRQVFNDLSFNVTSEDSNVVLLKLNLRTSFVSTYDVMKLNFDDSINVEFDKLENL